MKRRTLKIAALLIGICTLSACTSGGMKYADPIQIHPYSISSLIVEENLISASFFKSSKNESYLFMTDTFLPLTDTTRRTCSISLGQCDDYIELIKTSRYWRVVDTPTKAGEEPAFKRINDTEVIMQFSREAIADSRLLLTSPIVRQNKTGEDFLYIEFNLPLFYYDAKKVTTMRSINSVQAF